MLVRFKFLLIALLVALPLMVQDAFADEHPTFEQAIISADYAIQNTVVSTVASVDVSLVKKISGKAFTVRNSLRSANQKPKKLSKRGSPCNTPLVKRILRRCIKCSCDNDYELKTTATPNDYYYPTLWGMNQSNDNDIDAPEGWDQTTGSSSVVIGVIDTGIKYDHADLASNIWVNPGEIPNDSIDNDGNGFVDDIYGINAITNSNNPMDDNGHGTHCAGTIGGSANNSIGVAGVAWNVRMIACKFLNSLGSGSTSHAIRCLDYLTDLRTNRGINVVASNNSWGGGGFTLSLQQAIQRANTAGILFVGAAGNDGISIEGAGYYPPAYNLPNMINVGSIASNGARSSFSNYGTTLVHISAPGSSILSTYYNGGYATLSGTSMATPHVTGAVALLAAANPSLNASSIRSAIINGASIRSNLATANNGGRLLKIPGALAAASVPTPTPTITSTPTLTPSNTPTSTPTATPTISPTPTITPTRTATPTITPTVPGTPSPTVTPTRTPQPTSTTRPTVTPTATPRPGIQVAPRQLRNGDNVIFDATGIGTLTIYLNTTSCGSIAVRNNDLIGVLPRSLNSAVKKVDARLQIGATIYRAQPATVKNKVVRRGFSLAQSCTSLMSSLRRYTRRN